MLIPRSVDVTRNIRKSRGKFILPIDSLYREGLAYSGDRIRLGFSMRTVGSGQWTVDKAPSEGPPRPCGEWTDQVKSGLLGERGRPTETGQIFRMGGEGDPMNLSGFYIHFSRREGFGERDPLNRFRLGFQERRRPLAPPPEYVVSKESRLAPLKSRNGHSMWPLGGAHACTLENGGVSVNVPQKLDCMWSSVEVSKQLVLYCLRQSEIINMLVNASCTPCISLLSGHLQPTANIQLHFSPLIAQML